MSRPITDVKILDRSGKKLCAIHCPQGWNAYIPIVIPPVSYFSENKWKDPQSIILWAWHQVCETNAYYLEHNVTNLSLDMPPAPCVVCGELSIKPVKLTTIFGFRLRGIQCENKRCAMHHVTIPIAMFQHLKEIPSEYIPEGFCIRNSS